MNATKPNPLLALSPEHTLKEAVAGEEILRQGEKRDLLLVLLQGEVEVVKNGCQICTVTESGAVFGEISCLLHSYQNATVRALTPCRFGVIPHAEKFLEEHPAASYHLARALARRLAVLDSHFAELKSKIICLQAESVGSALENGNGLTVGK
jgi:CRP-like cAMP-binding protein